jgi:hypothetical protein
LLDEAYAGIGGGWVEGNGKNVILKVPTIGHALVVKCITTGADVDINIKGIYTTISY